MFSAGRNLYLISDQRSYTGRDWAQDLVAILADLPKDSMMVQLREKNLGSRALLHLAAKVQDILSPLGVPLLINDRMDVALAVGAAGIHLRTTSFSVQEARSLGGPEFIIGASTHSLTEAVAKAEEGADFVVLGPIWETPSKDQYGEPLGMGVLKASHEALSRGPCSLFALGGITSQSHIEQAFSACDGVAAIRLFQDRNSPAFRSLQEHTKTCN